DFIRAGVLLAFNCRLILDDFIMLPHPHTHTHTHTHTHRHSRCHTNTCSHMSHTHFFSLSHTLSLSLSHTHLFRPTVLLSSLQSCNGQHTSPQPNTHTHTHTHAHLNPKQHECVYEQQPGLSVSIQSVPPPSPSLCTKQTDNK